MALTQWTAFVEVCRAGTIGGAAAALGYTQSAVSRQIAALEEEMQVLLLERLPRGVRPTPAGEALLHHARVVVNEAARGRDAAREAGRQAGAPVARLVVGAVPSAAATVVPDALARLERAGTPLQWSVVRGLTPDLAAMVRDREVDAAVATDAPPGPPPDSRLRLTQVGEDQMVAVVPAAHRLAATTGEVALADLAGERWIENNPGSEAMLRAMAARAGEEVRVDRAADDLMSKTGLVAAGHGIALVPGLLVPALRADVRVLRLRDAVRRSILLVERADEEAHEAFATALRGAAAALGRPA